MYRKIAIAKARARAGGKKKAKMNGRTGESEGRGE